MIAKAMPPDAIHPSAADHPSLRRRPMPSSEQPIDERRVDDQLMASRRQPSTGNRGDHTDDIDPMVSRRVSGG
jgi:hypothetical protein